MKKTFLFLFFLIFSGSIFSQFECGTADPDVNDSSTYTFNAGSNRSTYDVKVYLQRINNGNGENGVSDEVITDAFKELEKCLKDSDIKVVWDCNIIERDNENLYNVPEKKEWFG